MGYGPWQRPLWQLLPMMVVGNTVIALVLWLAAPRDFIDYWVVSNCVGFGVCFMQIACLKLLPGRRWLPVAFLMGVVLGAPLGLWVASQVGSAGLRDFIEAYQLQTLRFTVVGVLTGITLSLLWHAVMRVRELETEQREAALREVQREKQSVEAHLKLLQAQIEPHFLFNTLANLHSLIEQQPAAARHLLEQLNQYLRASLVHSRAARATLGDECELLGAYLEIQSIRMGARLSWRIDIDESQLRLPFAPMLLQPLVENAIVHGVEPCIEGGEVVLKAEREGGGLLLSVCDTGHGLGSNGSRAGQGLGLANVRERLQTLYGAEARLDVVQNSPRGVCAELWIPDSAF